MGTLIESYEFLSLRNLEENVTTTTNNNTDSSDDGLSDGNDSQVLKATLKVYGTFFVCVLILFSFLRIKFPRVYNLRSWVEDLQTPLAKERYGFFGWMLKVFLVTDSEMMEECGMDALCYTRVLEFGLRLSLIGMLNACWMIPVYYTAEDSPETEHITDPVVSISISNLPSGSYRFCATVVGAYVIFGFTMHSMLQEFEWFYIMRFQFLSRLLPRNYTIYVQNIPKEYRTDSKFLEFFQQTSAFGSVLDARIALKVPHLTKLVKKRENIIAKLEHKINLEEVKGETPTRINLEGKRVNTIDFLFKQLHELNKEISDSIDRIIEKRCTPSIQEARDSESFVDSVKPILATDSLAATTKSYDTQLDGIHPSPSGFSRESPEKVGYKVEFSGDVVELENRRSNTANVAGRANVLARTTATNRAMKDVANSAVRATTAKINNVAGAAVSNVAESALRATYTLNNVKDTANNVLFFEDGESRSAGFVTFSTLRAVTAAKQLVQYAEPFSMEVLEAPQPEDVFWANVGRDHRDLQIGKLMSLGLTTLLCLFWTIPMSFISSLSSVDGLRGQVKFIDDMLNAAPWLEPLLAQLAPLLIVAANELLAIILESMSMLEGPVSGAVVIASTFSKLAAFQIIQTFFVSAVSGSIFDELSNIAQEPTLVVDLLANSLPTQSTFFIQLLLVDTCVSLGLELLRVSALVQALIRRFVGPNLTEKERNTTWMFIRPLADPLEFEHDSYLAGAVLYFMVYFVYATIAPITTFFMAICFLITGAVIRHQFIYIFPTFPDSGGKLWVSFFRIVPVCMIIAEVTIVGLLGLKRAPIASAMMIPLLVITILFYAYINQQHFRLAEYMPAKECSTIDLRNKADVTVNYNSLYGKYIQPELQERQSFPENMTPEREVAQGLYFTPQSSERSDVENTNFDF